MVCLGKFFSCNLPGRAQLEDEIFIRDYNTHEGNLDALVKVGIISKPHRHLPQGFVQIPVCRLLK
jgi:hypothetical protein